MFFLLSKILYYLLLPLTWIVLLLLVRWLTRNPRLKRRAFRCAVGVLIIFSNPWLVNRAFYQTEYRTETHEVSPKVGVVLGGVLDSRSPGIEFNEASDRILTGMVLLSQNKVDTLVISGGSGDLLIDGFKESQLLLTYAEKLGLDTRRIRVEDKSRNTYENALYSRAIIKSDQILLITSAFHMKRAMGCFEKQGFQVTPYPVDYKFQELSGLESLMPSSRALRRWETLIKEWVGRVVYQVVGYS